MPRHKRFSQISEYHLTKIERQVDLLKIALNEATLMLTPLGEHYNAIGDLEDALRRALNILNGRPAEYVKPHGARR